MRDFKYGDRVKRIDDLEGINKIMSREMKVVGATHVRDHHIVGDQDIIYVRIDGIVYQRSEAVSYHCVDQKNLALVEPLKPLTYREFTVSA